MFSPLTTSNVSSAGPSNSGWAKQNIYKLLILKYKTE